MSPRSPTHHTALCQHREQVGTLQHKLRVPFKSSSCHLPPTVSSKWKSVTTLDAMLVSTPCALQACDRFGAHMPLGHFPDGTVGWLVACKTRRDSLSAHAYGAGEAEGDIGRRTKNASACTEKEKHPSQPCNERHLRQSPTPPGTTSASTHLSVLMPLRTCKGPRVLPAAPSISLGACRHNE